MYQPTMPSPILKRFLAIGLFLLLPLAAWAAPTVALTAPANGNAWNDPINLTLKASATADSGRSITRIDFYAGGNLIGSDTTSGYSFAWNAIPIGAHVLTAVATDSAGQSTTSAARTITVTNIETNIPPTVSLTGPANNATYALPVNVTLTANAADVEKNGGITLVEFLADGQVVGSSTTKPYSFTWTDPPAGDHTLSARATDVLGGQTVSAVSRALVINPNDIPPTVSLGALAQGTYLLPVSFTLTANADGGEINTPVTQVDFLANGNIIGSSTTKPYSFIWSNPAAGTYDVTARATDNRGISTDSAAKTVTIAAANTPPTANLTAPANNSSYVLPATIVVSANATDLEKNGGVTQVDFLANGSVIGTTTTKPYSITWSNPSPGTYTLVARATDTSGGQTDSTARTVTLSDENAPPKVNLTAPANNAHFVAPIDIALTANASGPETNTPIALVEFLADGSVIGTTSTKPYAATWSNAPIGTHTLTVRATDSLGAVTLSKARTIVIAAANVPPTVSLTSPASNTVTAAPANITVTANAADSDGTITQVDFYQGTTLIGSATTVPYTITWSNVASGSYTLTAIATDNQGITTTSAAVAIAVDAPPTVTLTNPTAGSVGIAPASFTLTATASDSDGTITKVDFYQGATLIGTATTAPYTFTWNNVPPGNYSLTAQATDNQGIATTSSAVSVSVIANTAPSINITSPTQGLSIKAPATVTLTATAADPDNNLATVAFYQNGTLITTLTNSPYTYSWTNVVQGSYVITATATDAVGAQTTSSPITITVTPAQASVYYIYPDHLGTPRLVTDASNNVVWRNLPVTEPFGNSPPEDDPNGTGNHFQFNLRFPGQYADQETNTNYNYFRDYDPSTGRYIESDPVGLVGGSNSPYTYVLGDPTTNIDPYGLLCLSPNEIKLIAATLGGGVTGGIAGKNWGGAILGAVVGFGAEYATQQAGLGNSGVGLSAIGAVAGFVNGKGGRASVVGAIAGSFGGLIQSQSSGDFQNTTSGGIAGILGTFAAELLTPNTPYGLNGTPLFGAVRGGIAGVAGGFTQDLTETLLTKNFQCPQGASCGH